MKDMQGVCQGEKRWQDCIPGRQDSMCRGKWGGPAQLDSVQCGWMLDAGEEHGPAPG